MDLCHQTLTNSVNKWYCQGNSMLVRKWTVTSWFWLIYNCGFRNVSWKDSFQRSWCCNAGVFLLVSAFSQTGTLSSFRLNSLVSVSIWGGGEVELHHRLELGLVAAVFESGVVVVTAEHVGLVVWQARAMKAKVVPALLVRVGLAHPVMGWQSCKSTEVGQIEKTQEEIP